MNRSSRRPAAVPVGTVVRLVATLACALLLATRAQADQPPRITSFSPTRGIAGSTVVTMYGTGFKAPMFASFYGEAAILGVNVISSTELTVLVPGEAITGVIGISGANGATGTPDKFVVTGHAPLVAVPSFEVVGLTQEIVLGSGQVGTFTLDTPMANLKDVWVHYALSGSAVNGQDYLLRAGLVKVKARVGRKMIKIIPQGDLGGAAKRTVKFTLLPGEGYLVAQQHTGKLRIVAGK